MIQCVEFSKNYDKNNIINNSNFEFKKSRISFLMGPNGSGKTTLIKCLMGMEHYSGKITFNEKSINDVREKCLVIWDDCPFYSNLSGLNNLLIFSEQRKTKDEIIKISQNFIDESLLKKKVKKYSYGQKKKLALALVDILEPEFLIMDEISNGLDYDSIRKVNTYIKNWSKTKVVLLTGHQFGFYNKLIDDLFIIKNKEIHLYKENFTNYDLTLEDIYDEEIHESRNHIWPKI